MNKFEKKLVKVAIKLWEKSKKIEEQKIESLARSVCKDANGAMLYTNSLLEKQKLFESQISEFLKINNYMFSTDERKKYSKKTINILYSIINMLKSTCDSFNYINSCIKIHINDFEPKVQQLGEKKELYFSIQDSIEELFSLKDHFKEKFYLKEGHFVIVTDSIILRDEEEYNFGEFEIWFNFSDHNNQRRPFFVKAKEPLKHCRDNFFHPHVDLSGNICEGEAAESITIALMEGRFSDVIFIIINLLSTYNYNSPYRDLNSWYYSYSCVECGSNLDSEDIYYCDACGEDESYCYDCLYSCSECNEFCCDKHLYQCACCCSNFCSCCVGSTLSRCYSCGVLCCEDCRATCYECEENFCGDCLKECYCCNKKVCKECLKVCNCCGELFCNNCSDDNFDSCYGCKKSCCDECLIKCNCCKEYFCEDCLNICNYCGEKICDGCFEECNGCKKWYCSNCLNSCDGDCEETYCSSCINFCQQCQESFCSECIREHGGCKSLDSEGNKTIEIS